MNNDPVSTADAKLRLVDRQRFDGYPKLTFDLFQILLDRMPDQTTPIDFLMRFEESLDDVAAQPHRFGNASVFVWAMRLNAARIAATLFDRAFGDAVQDIYDRTREEEEQSHGQRS